MVGSCAGFESVGGTAQRQALHTRVGHQNVDGVNRIGELAHAGEVGNVAVYLVGGLFAFGDGAIVT